MRYSRAVTLSLFVAILLGCDDPTSLSPTAATPEFDVDGGGTAVFINEIHYDDEGPDAGEAIEVAGPASTSLTGWSLVLYDGSGGSVYDTRILSGSISDLCNGFGVLVENLPENGLQNGPDGVALVDDEGGVVQFLSYEGTFTAVDGPAAGMTSTDIGVDESPSPPDGSSLQLSGTGTVFEDFMWQEPAPNTFGDCNTGQEFVSGVTVLDVTIDIKPGSDPNAINLSTDGVIPVAILTTDDFDATTVDPLSVEFGPAGATEVHNRGHIEDADGDGDDDMVLHFRTQETGIEEDDTEACLTGETVDGTAIEGCDEVKIVG